MNRRTLHYFIDQYNAGDPEIRDLLRRTELWFVIVANPDGYQYTFDVERLWRKNLRDNNQDGQITIGDGVDPNRNFADHWGYDNEGSSPDPADETYRGPSAASEPETQAMQSLINRIKPKFMSNMHSTGEWLLYPQGWQTGTLDADNPVYVAVAGTDANPAVPGFNPGQSADTLYVTNGETTDYADARGTVAITPELGSGIPGAGFVFPDDEALVQAEFERILPFHLALARSAPDPDDPVSPSGIDTQPFYLDQDEIDPQNGAHSLFDFTFDQSYGDTQEVRVLAKRSLTNVKLVYRINGGDMIKVATQEWNGGERYGPGAGTHYHVIAGNVPGTAVGDEVEVWFEGGGAKSDSFTYDVVSDSGRPPARGGCRGLHRCLTGVCRPERAELSELLHRCPHRQRRPVRRVRRRRQRADGAGQPRHPQPLRRGPLVHRQRHRDPRTGLGSGQRLAPGHAGDLRAARLHERGRPRLYTGQRAGQQYTTRPRAAAVRPVRERPMLRRARRSWPAACR